MRVETTSEDFARAVNGTIIHSEKPKTVIRNSREIVILGDVNKKRDTFLRLMRVLNEKAEIDATVKVFISPLCPVCPHVVEELFKLPIRRVEVIDVTDYPEIAQSYEVMATPTIVIGKVKLVGKVDGREILEWIERGYDRKSYFAKLLKEGRADEVVKEIVRDGDADILIELLTFNDFMVRLGAMVVVEEIAKEKPELIEKIKSKLRELLKHEDERIRQDIAMLLGNVGDTEDKKFLKELVKEGGDVGESAKEAMEEIDRRNQK